MDTAERRSDAGKDGRDGAEAPLPVVSEDNITEYVGARSPDVQVQLFERSCEW